ncbi:hypothetical protein ACFWWB_15900 [Streptomyces sp. NPDC058690]|uniref:hypothetical protein n=1 Tax=Streptomyces sp. NPDC058690 TaxID=3346600 RepID=UPI003661C5D3
MPSSADAVVPILVVPAALVAGTLALFGLDAPDGPIQVPLVMRAMTAALVAMKNGHSRSAVQRADRGVLSNLPHAVLDHASPALSVLHRISGYGMERTQPVAAGPTAR